MKQSHISFVGVASILLVAVSAFTACGGLDPRKVSRGPDYAAGGEDASGGSSSSGPGPGAGGSESKGGEPSVNPFGGNYDLGGAPPVVDGPPEVVMVDPADGAVDVEPDGSISLLFSEGLDEATVSTDSVQITDAGEEVAGDVSYAGVIGTFEPARRLSLLASYDVSVSTAITDIGGTALNEAFSSSFTVRDGIWSEQKSVFVEQDLWNGEQQIGSDARGNILVVWTRVSDAMNGMPTIMGRWYRPTTGWQPEAIIETGTDYLSRVKVAVSPVGDAIVAWFAQDAASNFRVRARRFVGGAWEAAAKDVPAVNAEPFNSYPPELAVAIGGGQCVVAWIRTDYVPDPYAVYNYLRLAAATLEGAWPDTPGGSFSAAYTAPNYESLNNLTAAVDADGNAIAAFYYSGVSADPMYGGGIYYTRKAAAGAWQYPAKIPGTFRAISGPFLASDGEGGMAVWSTYDDMTQKYSVMASRYTKAKQFVAGVPINDPDLTEWISLPHAGSVAGNGSSFIATWVQNVGNSRNTYANRYDIASSKWDELPTVVSDGVATGGQMATVGVDHHGNALVAFEQEVAEYQSGVMIARYVAADDTWTISEQPISLMDNTYGTPLLVVGGNGVAGLLFQGGGRQSPTGGGQVAGGQYAIFK